MGKNQAEGPSETTEPAEGAKLGIMAGGKAKKKTLSKSTRAGLVFPVAKVNKHLRQAQKSSRVGGGAPIYLAGVLEYAAAEILEMAMAGMSKRKRITPTDILRGVRSDRELNIMLAGTSVFVGDRVAGVSQAVTVAKPVQP